MRPYLHTLSGWAEVAVAGAAGSSASADPSDAARNIDAAVSAAYDGFELSERITSGARQMKTLRVSFVGSIAVVFCAIALLVLCTAMIVSKTHAAERSVAAASPAGPSGYHLLKKIPLGGEGFGITSFLIRPRGGCSFRADKKLSSSMWIQGKLSARFRILTGAWNRAGAGPQSRLTSNGARGL